MGFSQGLSGLNAAASNLDVIGNNVANQGTVGFKSGSATFADVFAGSRVGLGVQVSGVNQRFTTGTISGTGNELDIAISGNNGFFRLLDTNGSVIYSRNGQFFKDASNNIVNIQGHQLTGYTAGVGSDPVPLNIPAGSIDPLATGEAGLVLNLDSRTPPIDADDFPFDSTNANTYSFIQPLTVYDSLGNSHQLVQHYIKRESEAGNSQWDVQYVLDGDAANAVSHRLSFTPEGRLLPATSAATLAFSGIGGAASPADDLSIAIDYTGSTQFGNANTYAPLQNGYTAGQFTSVSVSGDGTLSANYSNGQSQPIGIVALASFNSMQGLQPRGGNAWTETTASGAATLGQPGNNGLGSLVGQSVEESNVDISRELVNMIIAQRTYQANAQTIKTQDNILQTLVTMR